MLGFILSEQPAILSCVWHFFKNVHSMGHFTALQPLLEEEGLSVLSNHAEVVAMAAIIVLIALLRTKSSMPSVAGYHRQPCHTLAVPLSWACIQWTPTTRQGLALPVCTWLCLDVDSGIFCYMVCIQTRAWTGQRQGRTATLRHLHHIQSCGFLDVIVIVAVDFLSKALCVCV